MLRVFDVLHLDGHSTLSLPYSELTRPAAPMHAMSRRALAQSPVSHTIAGMDVTALVTAIDQRVEQAQAEVA
jgi:ATP-dependent DNA ligase